MTETKDQPPRYCPVAMPAWFALLCSVAAISIANPAMASSSGQPMPKRGAVAEKARKEAKEQREEKRDALEAATGAGKLLSNAAVPDDTFYGPPAPKARRGDLPTINWTEPTDHVPPALDEAINIVTANYPSARSARAALKAAASDVKAAKWLRFPSVTGNLEYLDDSSSPEPQLIVETPLWSGGRINSGIRRARAIEDVSSAQYVQTVQNLALTTSQTYFEVARLTQREQLLEGSLKEHRALVATMERRVKQEISPLADLELARSRSAQIEQEYTITSSQRRTTLRILAELIADPTYDLGPIPRYDPDSELTNRDALEDQAVAYSPDLKRLHGEADVSRADLAGRRASILPQLNAQYSYDDVFGSRVGVVVRAQSTGGLSQFSEMNSAKLRIQSSLENIRVADQQLRRDIQSTLILYDAAKRRAIISKSAASTAARVSASYTRQFIAGRRSWLDVMNALREAVTAEMGRSDAEVTVMSTATQLLLQSGRWRPVFREAKKY
ncbi:MAG: TolC family protein [Sphingomonadaceae bacterium]|nr:TolC family protein [Sphingomonadaceae bacterium]